MLTLLSVILHLNKPTTAIGLLWFKIATSRLLWKMKYTYYSYVAIDSHNV